MFTDEELKELFEDIESDRVERKKTEADGKKCAMRTRTLRRYL